MELLASHQGGKIHIEVRDDGRGLDRDAIAAKARERGLLKPGDTPGEREVLSLVMMPGFSTARKVTDVSGRGVGLDVVKRNVEALRGQIELRSEAGKGCVFSLRLPLTLAIIDGMVVRLGDERCIIPTLSVLRSIRPRAADVSTVLGRGELLSLQGTLIPLFRLGRILGQPRAEGDPTRGVVVVVEDDSRQVGLLVDELLGQQQIVIKSLGDALREVPGVAGGPSSPTGRSVSSSTWPGSSGWPSPTAAARGMPVSPI